MKKFYVPSFKNDSFTVTNKQTHILTHTNSENLPHTVAKVSFRLSAFFTHFIFPYLYGDAAKERGIESKRERGGGREREIGRGRVEER